MRKGNEGLFEGHPFAEIWVWNKARKYRDLLRLLRAIRKTRFDLVINLQRFASSGLLTALSRAKETRGFEKNPFSPFFTQKHPHPIAAKGAANFLHETERNHALIADLAGTQASLPRLYPDDLHAGLRSKEIFDLAQAETYLTIAPASVWATKAWPESRWIELLDKLHDYRVFILGSPGDFALAGRMQEASTHPRVVNACGHLSLLESALLMRGASMNFVNDSAPMHLCSAVGAPVTAVYCSTIPEFGFGPLGPRAFTVQTKSDLSCRPCGLHGHRSCPEGHFNCAQSIELTQLTSVLPTSE